MITNTAKGIIAGSIWVIKTTVRGNTQMCKCGHTDHRHNFRAWLPNSCLDCFCDDYEPAKGAE